jgi:uncharacterized membrane protein
MAGKEEIVSMASTAVTGMISSIVIYLIFEQDVKGKAAKNIRLTELMYAGAIGAAAWTLARGTLTALEAKNKDLARELNLGLGLGGIGIVAYAAFYNFYEHKDPPLKSVIIGSVSSMAIGMVLALVLHLVGTKTGNKTKTLGSLSNLGFQN